MKQFSLLDLPARPDKGPDGPSLWWAFKYKSMHEQAVADFLGQYKVKPIFYLDWLRRQVFLTEPDQAIVVDKETGLLAKTGRKALWEKDYRSIKTFRPQDVAPQVRDVLSGGTNREAWRPMVMAEFKINAAEVEGFIARLMSLNAFWQHWPAFRESHMFRVFGEPGPLDGLRYPETTSGGPS